MSHKLTKNSKMCIILVNMASGVELDLFSEERARAIAVYTVPRGGLVKDRRFGEGFDDPDRESHAIMVEVDEIVERRRGDTAELWGKGTIVASTGDLSPGQSYAFSMDDSSLFLGIVDPDTPSKEHSGRHNRVVSPTTGSDLWVHDKFDSVAKKFRRSGSRVVVNGNSLRLSRGHKEVFSFAGSSPVVDRRSWRR